MKHKSVLDKQIFTLLIGLCFITFGMFRQILIVALPFSLFFMFGFFCSKNLSC